MSQMNEQLNLCLRKLRLRDLGSVKSGLATVSVEVFRNCQH